MRKSIFVLLCLNSICAAAQLQVNSNGKVIIGAPTVTGSELNVAGGIEASTYEIKVGTATRGSLGRGATVTSAWNNTPDAMTLTYYQTDFAIGGFNKITGNWNGANLFIRTDSNYVGINKTTPGYPLDVTGTIRTSANVIQASDERLKKNITPLENALENISKLHGKRYEKDIYFSNPERKRQEQSPTEVEYGVMAQEVQKVFPELVKTDANGIMGVNYSGLIPVLIEAMKEQQGQIAEKTEALKALPARPNCCKKL